MCLGGCANATIDFAQANIANVSRTSLVARSCAQAGDPPFWPGRFMGHKSSQPKYNENRHYLGAFLLVLGNQGSASLMVFLFFGHVALSPRPPESSSGLACARSKSISSKGFLSVSPAFSIQALLPQSALQRYNRWAVPLHRSFAWGFGPIPTGDRQSFSLRFGLHQSLDGGLILVVLGMMHGHPSNPVRRGDQFGRIGSCNGEEPPVEVGWFQPIVEVRSRLQAKKKTICQLKEVWRFWGGDRRSVNRWNGRSDGTTS